MVVTDSVYDCLGIGFGPVRLIPQTPQLTVQASLAVAIAFAEGDTPIKAGFIDVRLSISRLS